MTWKQALEANGETAIYTIHGEEKAAVGILASGMYDCQVFGVDRHRKSKLTDAQVEEHLCRNGINPNSNWR